MDVKEILKKYLTDNDYDGLFCPGKCACLVDDLFPCEEMNYKTCEPGYKNECGDCKKDGCVQGLEVGFCVSREKGNP